MSIDDIMVNLNNVEELDGGEPEACCSLEQDRNLKTEERLVEEVAGTQDLPSTGHEDEDRKPPEKWSSDSDVEQFRTAMRSLSSDSETFRRSHSSPLLSNSGNSTGSLLQDFLLPMAIRKSGGGHQYCSTGGIIKEVTSSKALEIPPDIRKKFSVQTLGRGAFGRVFGIRIRGKLVAVKDVSNVEDPAEKNAMNLFHRNVVRTLHVTEIAPRRFLVFMEYAGSQTLQQMMDDKLLDKTDALRFSTQIASALQFCHEHDIIHLDVKPSNILVSDLESRLSDFGSSIKRGSYPRSGGTVQYMAPEVLCNKRPDLAADVYSLGILLWQMDTGQRPFSGQHPHAIIYQVVQLERRPTFPSTSDPSLVCLVSQCWKPTPADRPSMQIVHRRLASFFARESHSYA